MTFLKKIYVKIFGEKKSNDQKSKKCWYNNAHENGAATHSEIGQATFGSNGFELTNARQSGKPM